MLFEKAARLKVRFNFRGQISAEDLWDLRLEDLDAIYKELKAQQKKASEDSLLDKPTRESEILDLQVEIVKHVFEAKQEEQEDRKAAVGRRQRKRKLMEILEKKQDASLEGLSEKQLQKMVADLED